MNSTDIRRINLAQKCINAGKNEYAVLVISKLMSDFDNENKPDILNEVGKLYLNMGIYRKAQELVQKSFDIEKSVETLKLLAKVNNLCGNYEDAAIQYEELIKYEPEESNYLKSASAYNRLGFLEEAIRIYKLYVEKYKNVRAYSELALAYITMGLEQEAIDACEDLKKIAPNHPMTMNTLGFLYEAIYYDYEKAKEYFLKSAKSGFKEAYYNLGVCNKQSENLEDAEKYLKRLISLKVDLKEIDYQYTLGSIYLAQRKLAQGYKYYKNRTATKIMNERNKNRLWDGKSYPKETLYIRAEQGYGDNIQFIRYIPMAAEKFKNVIFGTYPNLVELFQRSFPVEKYPNIKIVSTDVIVRYNKFIPLLDIPYLLHTNFHNIPAQKQYLICSERKKDMFKNNFFETDRKKVGICWRAKGMGIRDAVYRTIDAPYYFRHFFENDNVKFYSFQMNDIFDMCEKYPQIVDLAPHIKTFDDTAAALMNLDVLITVDTALAHLAGALGVKTYLLLCHAPDWRWFDNTEKTEWYPSVTIIKQNDRKTWEDVSEKITKIVKTIS